MCNVYTKFVKTDDKNFNIHIQFGAKLKEIRNAAASIRK